MLKQIMDAGIFTPEECREIEEDIGRAAKPSPVLGLLAQTTIFDPAEIMEMSQEITDGPAVSTIALAATERRRAKTRERVRRHRSRKRVPSASV